MKSTVWSFDKTEPEFEWKPSTGMGNITSIKSRPRNCAPAQNWDSWQQFLCWKRWSAKRANGEDRDYLVGHSTILDWTSCILTLYCRTHSKKLSGFNFLEFTFKKDGQKRFFIKSKYKFLLNRNLWLSHHCHIMAFLWRKATARRTEAVINRVWIIDGGLRAHPTSQNAACRIFCISYLKKKFREFRWAFPALMIIRWTRQFIKLFSVLITIS